MQPLNCGRVLFNQTFPEKSCIFFFFLIFFFNFIYLNIFVMRQEDLKLPIQLLFAVCYFVRFKLLNEKRPTCSMHARIGTGSLSVWHLADQRGEGWHSSRLGVQGREQKAD